MWIFLNLFLFAKFPRFSKRILSILSPGKKRPKLPKKLEFSSCHILWHAGAASGATASDGIWKCFSDKDEADQPPAHRWRRKRKDGTRFHTSVWSVPQRCRKSGVSDFQFPVISPKAQRDGTAKFAPLAEHTMFILSV